MGKTKHEKNTHEEKHSSKSGKNGKAARNRPAPDVDALLTAVTETAREAASAALDAERTAEKAVKRKKALAQAKAKAATARRAAAKAADELRVAQDAASLAVENEKDAAKALRKAKKKRDKARKKAGNAASLASDARDELNAVPPLPSADTDRVDQSAIVVETVRPEQSPAAVPAVVTDPDSGSVPLKKSDVVPVDSSDEIVAPERLISTGEDAPEAVTVDAVTESGPAGDWTLVRLRNLARERQLRGYSAMSKARLLEVLLSETGSAARK